MIDEPGPWGTGPFTLVQGASSILTRKSSWLRPVHLLVADRVGGPSAELVLEANLDHWNRAERGPRVQRAVFRNNLSPSQALDLCLAGDGEVDIVTEVSPADAERITASQYARLVTADANRVLTCIINRGRADVPLDSVDVRKALNMAVDRDRIMADGLLGYANPMPAMTPSWCSGFPAGATPYPHDPAEAKRLFEKGGWPPGGRSGSRRPPVRRASPRSSRVICGGRSTSRSRWSVVPDEAALAGARALVEKKLDLPWDLLVHAWFDLSSEAPPAAVHREYFGKDGAFRAGPLDDGFDALFARMAVELDGAELVRIAEEIDAYCFDNALAVFLCAPQALYAVNNHVSFGPYKTTFEIAEVTVDEGHWSRQPDAPQRSGASTPPAAASKEKPGFAGAAGNAC